MDNFRIDITSEHKPTFELAIAIGFRQNETGSRPSPQKATHYVIHPEYGMVFLWSGSDGKKTNHPTPSPLPFPMEYEQAASMAWEWLTKHAEYPPEDHNDHDIWEHKGWRVYNEMWGHVGPYDYAIVAVKPAWAWYGK